jgi:hypothetical protein
VKYRLVSVRTDVSEEEFPGTSVLTRLLRSHFLQDGILHFV